MCSLEELNPKRGIQDGQKYLTVPKYFPAVNLINAVWLKDTAQHSGCCKKIQLVEQDVLKSSPTAVSQAVVMILLVFFVYCAFVVRHQTVSQKLLVASHWSYTTAAIY